MTNKRLTDREESPPVEAPAIDGKWLACNGRQYRKLVWAGLLWLEKHCQRVNDLNVFPVPDGDTGTNMLLTMRAAYNRVADVEIENAGKMAHEVAQGALMGARGNSGVILSQIWRGLAKGLAGKAVFEATDLAQALEEAANTAYKGVMKPVEGTLLTVIRQVSLEGVDAAQKSGDLRFVLERIVERAEQAVERTPEQLPILKQAGVVDSGGQGLFYILEGMIRYINGLPFGEDTRTSRVSDAKMPAQAFAVPEGGSIENPYDVQFILMGDEMDLLQVRRDIDAMGDSTVVVGDEQTIKVHIHVKDPGEPLSYGIQLGHITDVVVENMQEQMEEITGKPMPASVAPPVAPEIEPGQVGVVAVAPGAGVAKAFLDLGVTTVVNGGQTNNPSAEEIFQAIQDVPTNRVIILPNNKNIQMAAEVASELTTKEARVIPTRTVPQGVAALIAYSRDGDLEQLAGAMDRAAAEVASGEITVATRSVTLDGVEVEEGDIIGIAEGRLCAAGKSWKEALPDTLAGMGAEDRELLSIFFGQNVTQAQADALSQQAVELYPDLEVEILPGGQAHYDFILGAE